MANHKQAEKRIRQSEKRRLRNRANNSRVKTFMKKFEQAVATQDKAQAAELLPVVVKEVMKAGAKGLYHKNKISRKVSQIQKAYNALA
ncbi:30S ribosomal protein S20 [bacterium]|nr:30S ribosomal protein S20 [bacterium]